MSGGSPNRVAWRRVLTEAIAGLGSSPARSILAAMGTLVGVGSVVTVLGLTATANGQIDESFTKLSSTSIRVDVNEAVGASTFPRRAISRVNGIEGVVDAAVVATIDNGEPAQLHPGAPDPGSESPRVAGVSVGYWRTVDAPLLQGRLIDARLAREPVAVLGERTAQRLGVTDVADQVMITFRGVRFLVIGITGPASRDQVTAGDIAIPHAFVRDWLPPDLYTEQMLVVTEVGAGEAVATQVATAVAPFRPESAVAHYTARPRVVDDAVSAELRSLFLMLALISTGIAGLGIVNVSLMAVLERRREIGLRRALGARRGHIVMQFVVEAGIVGIMGGAVGGAVGQLAVVAVSKWQGWTTTLEPLVTLGAAPLGLCLGVLAGLYPALRAARVSPVEALRAGA
ncbi:ABC transporter permease [Nocardioides dubius]|uniref:ABC transporter permease n=1 Tax=Nocardioides dubius TaxID=317019 RepID=A0ABN1TTD2_9ACTN